MQRRGPRPAEVSLKEDLMLAPESHTRLDRHRRHRGLARRPAGEGLRVLASSAISLSGFWSGCRRAARAAARPVYRVIWRQHRRLPSGRAGSPVAHRPCSKDLRPRSHLCDRLSAINEPEKGQCHLPEISGRRGIRSLGRRARRVEGRRQDVRLHRRGYAWGVGQDRQHRNRGNADRCRYRREGSLLSPVMGELALGHIRRTSSATG